MKSRRGQILPLALALVFVMALMWIMLINVGFLIKSRIQLQIAADTAAQTAAAYKARGLNIVGRINAWLGVPILGIGIPQGAWWPVPPHPMGAGTFQQSAGRVREAIETIKKMTRSGFDSADLEPLLEGALTGLMGYFGGAYDTHDNFAELQKRFVQMSVRIQECYNKPYGGGEGKLKALEIARGQGADGIYSPPGSFSLRLERNRGSIWYLRTTHMFIHGRPLPLPIPMLPKDIGDRDDDSKRWYEQGPQFYRKTLRVYAYCRKDSARNKTFPLGRQLFQIQPPALYAVAAARVFNPGGPMFPSPEETQGWAGGKAALDDHEAAKAGWQAQLVPVGGPYVH